MPDTIDAKALATTYGFAYNFLKSVPELWTFFQQAVADGWEPQKFIAEVQGTKWYRKTADTAREWIALQAADPATAKQRLDERKLSVQTLAQQMGLDTSDINMKAMALSSIMAGWNDTQLRRHLTATYHYQAAATGKGAANTTENSINELAASYVIPVSNQAKEGWIKQVLNGSATLDDFHAWAADQARSLYPQMTGAIDRGITVDQYLDPYRQLASKELGMSPDQVDWLSPKWSDVLGHPDDKGNRKIMSLQDWQVKIRTDKKYGWDDTQGARDAIDDLRNKFSDMFGAF